MTLLPEKSITMGKYVVSPTTHLNEAGSYRASVAIKTGQGMGTHHRVLRFGQLFSTREGARLFALTQGWLQTLSPRTLHA
jgi:hypothetical protein